MVRPDLSDVELENLQRIRERVFCYETDREDIVNVFIAALGLESATYTSNSKIGNIEKAWLFRLRKSLEGVFGDLPEVTLDMRDY